MANTVIIKNFSFIFFYFKFLFIFLHWRGNDFRAIFFVISSTDYKSARAGDIEQWKKYCEKEKLKKNSYIVKSQAIEEYKVIGIPRFIIIDKEFKLIDAYAPVSENPAFEEIIKSNL